jgi:uncharacterized protein YwgA
MNRIQLATLLSWAGDAGIQGRKRLQKVAFFLQQAGCPLNCQYTLHFFGPYSRDVADACDEMVVAGLIEEVGNRETGVMQYTYKLKPSTHQYLRQVADGAMSQFEKIGKELIQENIWRLELGSTILFHYRFSGDWKEAMRQACLFKKADASNPRSIEALELAKRFVTASTTM